MGKRSPSEPTSASRFSAVYWRTRVYRPTYTKEDGTREEVGQYYARLQHGGTRREVPLATNSAVEAAGRAAKLYQTLKAKGWADALALFRPDSEPKPGSALRIGDLLAVVREYGGLPPRTFGNYSYALRRIALDIVGEKIAGSRFDPAGRFAHAADGIPLAKLSDPLAIEDWRHRFKKARGGDPIRDAKAIRSGNSYLVNARALFSRRLLDVYRLRGLKLPDPLPFHGVKAEQGTGSTRYHSVVNAAELLRAGKEELEDDPAAYGILLLALGAGLRRGEIDGLTWFQVREDQSIIHVAPSAQRRLKTEDSEGDVPVDPSLVRELKRIRRKGSTAYVIEEDVDFHATKAAQFYRCESAFKRLTAWLRKNGVNRQRPLHDLRKEAGSVINAAAGIHAASVFLRHADIETTAKVYADARARVTVPIASMLGITAEKDGSC